MTYIPANSNRDFWAALAAMGATLAALFGGTALARRIARPREEAELGAAASTGEPGHGDVTPGASH
ncbi:MAG TPA: hypothetical protein VMJ70_07750 [Candidatus Sulfotelmatobacter sp.]|nr:hypothetical protein [Candidatus Sulfotelmatobacter sp.]